MEIEQIILTLAAKHSTEIKNTKQRAKVLRFISRTTKNTNLAEVTGTTAASLEVTERLQRQLQLTPLAANATH